MTSPTAAESVAMVGFVDVGRAVRGPKSGRKSRPRQLFVVHEVHDRPFLAVDVRGRKGYRWVLHRESRQVSGQVRMGGKPSSRMASPTAVKSVDMVDFVDIRNVPGGPKPWAPVTSTAAGCSPGSSRPPFPGFDVR